MTDRVLLLKTVASSCLAYHDFRWPGQIGAVVEAPDWNPDPTIECGRGLHALLWGEGDGRLLHWEPDATWRVLSADPADIVPSVSGDKVRCRRVRQEYVGDRLGATAMILAVRPQAVCVGATVTGGYGAMVTGGYRATVTGGDRARVTGGYGATVTGGYEATVTGGDGAMVTGGDGAMVTGGYGAMVTGGAGATVTGGAGATVTGGAGANLILRWWDGDRGRLAVAYVGEQGIAAATAYRLDTAHQFVPVA